MTDHSADIARLRAGGTRFIFAQFADLHGVAKGKLLPVGNLADLSCPGAGFAGPSIAGFDLPRFGDRGEFYGRGDLASLQTLPWRPDVARVVCDGYVAGMPYAGCPRQILRRQVARLAERGWTLQVGIEPEFFLFSAAGLASGATLPADAADQLDKPSYDFKTLTRAPVLDFITELSDALQTLDFDVLQIDHEDANGQFEINYTYADALQAADRFMLFKMAASAIAERHSLAFSLMPKPFAERPGSGLHFHLSITDAAGNNLFDDGAGGLSALGRHALAGLLDHAGALCAIHAPTVNSYKRLVADNSASGTTWAPVHIAWGSNNRTTLARTVGNRVEWRLPDGTCNIYAALASIAAVIIDATEQRLEPPPPVEADMYEGVRQFKLLPRNLGEALDALAGDTLVKEALGVDFAEPFLTLKRSEWDAYRHEVSDWERRRYAFFY
jgi:glutamine synthetase